VARPKLKAKSQQFSSRMNVEMAERKPEWPEVGDLVIATIEIVTDYGAYAKLDEYNKRGLLHVSEISSSWIRNIRDFVREGQKVVLKVLRVDLEKGHIDLSLRRVTKREKIEKIKSWKKERKADALLRGVAEKVGLPVEEVYEKAGAAIDVKYGLYEGFEKAVKEGTEVLTKIGVPEDLAKAFTEVAQERIHIKMVMVKGTLEIRCSKPNGVKLIQESFLNAKKAEKARDANIRFYVVAAPKYSVEVMADNWKRAEEVLQKVAQEVVTNIVKAGGQGTFRREK
jgi:translation initiation factor 2 subunit 1